MSLCIITFNYIMVEFHFKAQKLRFETITIITIYAH